MVDNKQPVPRDRERIHERPAFAFGAVIFLFVVAVLWIWIANLSAP